MTTYNETFMEKTKISADITLQAAQKLLQFGLEYAEQKKLRLAIAIVDRSGLPVLFARMDDAALITVETALGKAKTAAYLQAPSRLFENLANKGISSVLALPGMLPLQGGVPLVYQDQVVGAVGVSGAQGDGDHRAAEIIASAFAA